MSRSRYPVYPDVTLHDRARTHSTQFCTTLHLRSMTTHTHTLLTRFLRSLVPCSCRKIVIACLVLFRSCPFSLSIFSGYIFLSRVIFSLLASRSHSQATGHCISRIVHRVDRSLKSWNIFSSSNRTLELDSDSDPREEFCYERLDAHMEVC
ncbi:hypothetical protein BC835DRAFT_1103712 [Cytidiella melzeri]|nr:hypothetical protein BC835DRAFT_1103712 [Cytidiella melzeri]